MYLLLLLNNKLNKCIDLRKNILSYKSIFRIYFLKGKNWVKSIVKPKFFEIFQLLQDEKINLSL